MHSLYVGIRLETIRNNMSIGEYTKCVRVIRATICDLQVATKSDLNYDERQNIIKQLAQMAFYVMTMDLHSAETCVRDIEYFINRGERFMKMRLLTPIEESGEALGFFYVVPQELRHKISTYMNWLK